MKWDAKRWPNFSENEMRCSHCGKLEMQPKFMDLLQQMREELGFPFIITSGYRCPDHPTERKKNTTGAHPRGIAADIAAVGKQAFEITSKAFELGFTGIGVSQRKDKGFFIHVDTRKPSELPTPRIWSY